MITEDPACTTVREADRGVPQRVRKAQSLPPARAGTSSRRGAALRWPRPAADRRPLVDRRRRLCRNRPAPMKPNGHRFVCARIADRTRSERVHRANLSQISSASPRSGPLDVANDAVVKKGDVLIRLDPRDYEIAVRPAKADLDQLHANETSLI